MVDEGRVVAAGGSVAVVVVEVVEVIVLAGFVDDAVEPVVRGAAEGWVDEAGGLPHPHRMIISTARMAIGGRRTMQMLWNDSR